jgi:inhibitor of the pro-sigma K processing machinery
VDLNLSQKIAVGLLAFFLAIALIRVFRTPLKLALKLLANTLLGFLALWVTNLLAGVTGFSIGLNIWNALTVGILGVPGFVLLLLLRWIL